MKVEKVEGITSDEVDALQTEIEQQRREAFKERLTWLSAKDDPTRQAQAAAAHAKMKAAFNATLTAMEKRDGLCGIQAEAQAYKPDFDVWIACI